MTLRDIRRMRGLVLLFGPLVFVLVFLVVPYLIMFSYSFYLKTYPTFQPDFQFGNYLLIVTDPQYYRIFLRTFKIAAVGDGSGAAHGLSHGLLSGFCGSVGALAHDTVFCFDSAALDVLSDEGVHLEDHSWQRRDHQFLLALDWSD